VVVREEVANSVTHGLGLLTSLVGAFVLVSLSVEQGEAWHIVSAVVYGATLVAMYAASTLYHAFKGTRARNVLRVLDHCAIYLLIAGTYTPVTLVTMRGGWGWTLFGLAWGLAAVGIVFKVLATGRFAVISTLAYVLMGWLCIIAAKPMIILLSPGALALLVLGGVFYTAGIVFYNAKRIPYSHAVWHLFVVAGSVCHYLAIALYVLARKYPDRLSGLFFFNCPFPGIGERWVESDHVNEIWYQSFNQQPWAASLVGENRKTCELYIGHFLDHWSHEPGLFDEDLDLWVDNFMEPGNLQGGFNWYISTNEGRIKQIRDGAPDLPKIETPTRVLWGGERQRTQGDPGESA
jgi:hemolysin III